MKIIKSILSNYIDIPKNISNQELGDIITKHIAEIEKIIDQKKEYENIVVGEIKEINSHPNADKLKITQIDVGEKNLVQILCGGSNIRIGQKVVIAKLKAKVYWHGDPIPTIMKKAKIRGEISEGMICAAEEVKIEDEFCHKKKEIVELPQDAKVGMSLSDYLEKDDIAFDIDNKSLTHRPDLWGHYGFARDLACVLKIPFREYKKTIYREGGKLNIQNLVGEKCLCLSSQEFQTGLPKKSPNWLKKVLEISDIKSINTLVDITNLVMLEFGQPLHAYDKRFLEGDLQVKFAKNGEIFTTLDDREHKLTEEDLLISDSKKAVGLAGIMGGKNSEIKEDTTDIVIEIATFDPVSIRKTATRVGLSTDASKRFEKALDPYLPELVMSRVRELLEILHKDEYKPISTYTMIQDQKAKTIKNMIIYFDPEKINAIMGKVLDNKKDILLRLGCDVDDTKKIWKVTIPTFRATKDMTQECDLTEEICRISGYHNIKVEPFYEEVDLPLLSEKKQFQRTLSQLFSSLGVYEAMSYSFVGEELMKKFDMTTSDLIPLANTLSSEYTHLRNHLLPTLSLYLDSTFKQTKNVKVFEYGNIFSFDEKVQEVSSFLSLVSLPEYKKDLQVFYEAKSLLDAVLRKLKLSCLVEQPKKVSLYAHPYRYCEYVFNKKQIAKVYEIHPHIIKNWKWKKVRVVAIEINVENLFSFVSNTIRYKEQEKFPRILKGVSVYLDKKILVGKVKEEIKTISSIIREVKITDFYDGEGVPDDKKAVAFEIQYFDKDKTLEDKDVEEIQNKVIECILKNGGEIRR